MSTSSSAKSTSNSSGSSTQVTDAPNSEDGKNAPDGISKDKDSDTPVIVGAVVGSVGGVALIVIAFFLGRRLAARKRSEKTANVQQQYYNQGKPELGGTEVGPVAGTTPGFWDQVAWQRGQQHGQHHGQVWQASELPSKYPAAHQMSSGMGPYEVGSNSGDGNYPGHTATDGVMK
jgi:flagellar biosynthesis/type III secretory pathway M-ring protein FliF/YscJ